MGTVISIHAPTRGATCNRDISVFIFIISIHAPTRGATVWRTNYIVSSLFQSTLLQEERRTDDHAGQICSAFQSTLLQEERQWTLQPNLLMLPISIHAPTSGATILGWFGVHKFYISIHAPTRGATPWLLKDFYNIMISINAPTRVATL